MLQEMQISQQAFGSKTKTKEEVDHIEDTQRLVTEIEMLKVVLYLARETEKNEKERGTRK